MSINIEKLENVTHALKDGDEVIIARCPACAEEDRDNLGNHLIVFPDGRFGCVVNPGEDDDSSEHRKRIFALVGEKKSQGRRPEQRFQPKIRMIAVPKREQMLGHAPKAPLAKPSDEAREH